MENADFTPEKLEQAKLLADTAAGRQLKELLQQTNAKGLRQAMEQAAQSERRMRSAVYSGSRTLSAFRVENFS